MLEERASGREESVAELIAYHYREAAALATAMDLDRSERVRGIRTDLVDDGGPGRERGRRDRRGARARAGALQFARDTDLPELYELLGDDDGGSPIIAAYAHASMRSGLTDLLKSSCGCWQNRCSWRHVPRARPQRNE